MSERPLLAAAEAMRALADAAEGMRSAHGPEHPRHEFWHAVAAWLSGTNSHDEHAVAVARAYLAGTS